MKHKLEEIFLEKKITGVSFDSRLVQSGDAFFAISGDMFDGNEYIDEALRRGAVVVFTDNKSKKGEQILYIEDGVYRQNLRKPYLLELSV